MHGDVAIAPGPSAQVWGVAGCPAKPVNGGRPTLLVVGEASRDVGLPIGTRVRVGARTGTVMDHQPEYSRGSFPVRFDDCIWEVLNAGDVTVLAPPPTGGAGHG